MKFSVLAVYLDRLEKTPSRLEITRILTELFSKTDKNEIDKVCYLSLGVLAPNYEGVLLNLAEKMMIRILSQAYEILPEKVTEFYKKSGDLGNTAEFLATSDKRQATSGLAVTDVYEKLLDIARDEGGGSQERKVTGMAGLLKSLDSLSARFVARIPIGKLRLGFSEKTIIVALRLASLAEAHDLSEKEVEEAYNIRPDIGYIAKLVKADQIKDVRPEVGVPVVPMLAQRLNSASEMIKKMGEVAVEPKFDGLRIFIHFRRKDNLLKIFTRNMNAINENVFPELKNFGKYVKADEIILDTEAVGVDPTTPALRGAGGFLDFQKTIQRRRKHDVEKSSGDIPLQFQVFDILLCDGKSFLKLPYKERRKEIERVVVNGNLLKVDEHTITSDPDVIRKLHEKYLRMGLEGVVVKRANGMYVSGRTGWNWVKMKEEEGKRGKLSDTLDCVVMGYSTGKGKRSGFGVGQFLAGVRDGDVFKTITKVGTGITDETFGELRRRLEKIKVAVKPKEYEAHKDLTPDFWVEPKIVVELAADEITKSPKHTAGFALRFPRLIKFRDDKSPAQATSIGEVMDILKIQKRSV